MRYHLYPIIIHTLSIFAPDLAVGSETIELFGTFAWLKPPRGGVRGIFFVSKKP